MRRSTARRELYLRSMVFAVAVFVVLSGIPIAAKWLLIGRWKQEVIPIWSLRYFRFWVVKKLDSKRAGGCIRRHADLQRVSAAARRQDRAQYGHRLAHRSGVHRPVIGRRQQHPAQGLHRARLQGAIQLHLYRIDRHRRQCVRRRRRACWISIPSWRTTPSWDTHRRCRAVNACPMASATTARRRRRRRPTIAPLRAKDCSRIRRGLYSVLQLIGIFAIVRADPGLDPQYRRRDEL